jgi:hypothetical protein
MKSIHELMQPEANSILVRLNYVFSIIYLNPISISELSIDLMNQDIAVVDLINLLIQKEQSRKLQELDKKEEKVNTIITNQTDGNRNNNQNINQNTNRRDKCDIYRCKHGREYIIKKDIISKN